MWGNDMSSDFARIILCTLPEARAVAMGDKDYSSLYGVVSFYPAGKGTLITAEVNGLPQTQTNIYAMHIHQGSSCTGNEQDPFADTGGHYNPGNLPHPEHLGDLPPLFGNGGFAYYSFYTEKFRPSDVIGRTVVIHHQPDDFKTQPSGDSGRKIGCGVIKKV
ncbi:MAG TPA: superoxide dismutase family protein [Candidatus Avimonas sp.]|nr:superoxide dismutase family protein [Clostridiales bacterium]HPU58181.1 superoxide dismutase family protein [Candidatus Avimonas sp.]